jgi:hypothetical protein
MSTRRLGILSAAIALSGGCALIAGYDFGQYQQTGGAGGAGGHAATSSARSSSSGGGASSVSTSSTTTSSTPTTSSATTTSSTATSSWVSTGTMAGSSSSGTGGAGSTKFLVKELVGPEAVSFDTSTVYYTTNVPSAQQATVGQVDKTGASPLVLQQNLIAAPAIASPAMGAYAAVNDVGPNGAEGRILPIGMASVPPVVEPGATLNGIAVYGSSVYFTDRFIDVFYIAGPGIAATFSAESPTGPIAADASGVYWSSISGEIVSATQPGQAPQSISKTPASPNAITTDMLYVYWTDMSGGVYRAAKDPDGSAPLVLNAGAFGSTSAYGIAVDGAGNVYFALGGDVYVAQFPYAHLPIPLDTGLVAPHGIALDGTTLYVADHGTPPTANGGIVTVAVP